MSRNVLKLSIAVVAFSMLVIASPIARTTVGNPLAEPSNMMRPDFDRVFSDVASANPPAFADVERETLRQIGLRRIFIEHLSR